MRGPHHRNRRFIQRLVLGTAVWLVAASSSAAGRSGETQAGCTYTVRGAQNGVAMGPAGGSLWITLDTQPGCEWTAFSIADFVAVRTETSPSVDWVTVYIDVEPNPSFATRWGWVYVTGNAIPVTQAGVHRLPTQFDSNADGHLDLLWQHEIDGRLAVWTMNGITQLTGEVLAQVSDTSWKVAGTGDLDADGHHDLVWQNIADGRVAAWLMNGTVLKEATPLSIPQVFDLTWRIAGVDDFNGDGHADLMWSRKASSDLAVWLMDGLQVLFAAQVPGWLPQGAGEAAGTGDFDEDGNVDVIFQSDDGGVLVWYMNGFWPKGWSRMTSTWNLDPAWRVRAVGDFDNDTRPDLIWQHATSGSLAVWFMNRSDRVSASLVSAPAVSDLGWRIVGPK